MKIKDYLKNTDKVCNHEYTVGDRKNLEMLHAAMGICTESGEIMDIVKKCLIYGKEVDRNNLSEEIGDLMWYVSILLREFDLDLEQVFEQNIAKLSARYPNLEFSSEKALNRDLTVEREVIDGTMDGDGPHEPWECGDPDDLFYVVGNHPIYKRPDRKIKRGELRDFVVNLRLNGYEDIGYTIISNNVESKTDNECYITASHTILDKVNTSVKKDDLKEYVAHLTTMNYYDIKYGKSVYYRDNKKD